MEYKTTDPQEIRQRNKYLYDFTDLQYFDPPNPRIPDWGVLMHILDQVRNLPSTAHRSKQLPEGSPIIDSLSLARYTIKISTVEINVDRSRRFRVFSGTYDPYNPVRNTGNSYRESVWLVLSDFCQYYLEKQPKNLKHESV